MTEEMFACHMYGNESEQVYWDSFIEILFVSVFVCVWRVVYLYLNLRLRNQISKWDSTNVYSNLQMCI